MSPTLAPTPLFEKALVLDVGRSEESKGNPIVSLSTLSGNGVGWQSEKCAIEASVVTLDEYVVWSSAPVSERATTLLVGDISKGSFGVGAWVDTSNNIGMYGYKSLGPVFLGGGLGWSHTNIVDAGKSFQSWLDFAWFTSAGGVRLELLW